MSLRFLHFPALAALGLFVAACATGPKVDPAVTAAASTRGVDQSTLNKMVGAQVLDYNDILNLVEHKVPSTDIVGYLTSTRKVYNFNYAQLQELKSAGASSQVLNYLTETQGFYGVNTPAQKARTYKEQRARYYRSPLYQDEAPFAYNQPIVDGWYDSGYAESLYSPFSFN